MEKNKNSKMPSTIKKKVSIKKLKSKFTDEQLERMSKRHRTAESPIHILLGNTKALYVLSSVVPILIGIFIFTTRYLESEKRKSPDFLLKEAHLFYGMNQWDFDESLKRFYWVQRVAEPDTPQGQEAAEWIAKIRKRQVLWLLDNKSIDLIRAQKFRTAKALFKNYNGPLAAETYQARLAQVAVIERMEITADSYKHIPHDKQITIEDFRANFNLNNKEEGL